MLDFTSTRLLLGHDGHVCACAFLPGGAFSCVSSWLKGRDMFLPHSSSCSFVYRSFFCVEVRLLRFSPRWVPRVRARRGGRGGGGRGGAPADEAEEEDRRVGDEEEGDEEETVDDPSRVDEVVDDDDGFILFFVIFFSIWC